MKNKERSKLSEFKERYQKSRQAYTELDAFARRQAQFMGSKKIPGGKDASIVWNFTAELIESQVDNSIPMPRVRPQRPTRRTLRLAKVIEDMIRGQLDRLPFETMNDQDERVCKIMGGSAYLVEWDNTVKTHDTVGDISVRVLDASQFIPQQGVFETRYMDYLFLTFEDTKERIENRYGVNVQEESVDFQNTQKTDLGDEHVTQVMCFYKNDSGSLGCFSWTGDTILVNDTHYEARKEKICARCGLTKPQGEEICVCGANNWKPRPKKYEQLDEDILDSVTGEKLVPAASSKGGKPTRLPYYYPRLFPVVIRRNISSADKALGISDCDTIRDFQLGANKLLSKINDKLLKSGSYLAKPSTMDFTFSDAQMTPINVDSPEQMTMLRTIDLRADINQDLSMVDKYYYMAKSVLGVTDSYQGKPDATAASGKAKEAQIAQAAGRQRSKRVMKYAAYADLFELMFKFMLAYADEPRIYTSTDENGEQIERVFSRYDFLEQDEAGEWFYNDQFLFSVDESGIDANDRQFMLADLRTDLSIGAYGDPSDPETMLAYWKEKEVFGYPNASRNVARWERKVQEGNAKKGGSPLDALFSGGQAAPGPPVPSPPDGAASLEGGGAMSLLSGGGKMKAKAGAGEALSAKGQAALPKAAGGPERLGAPQTAGSPGGLGIPQRAGAPAGLRLPGDPAAFGMPNKMQPAAGAPPKLTPEILDALLTGRQL